jgi:hypothetical protein
MLACSDFTGVGPIGSAFHFNLQSEKRKAEQPSRNAYPEISTKGLDPVRSEPPGGG